MIITENERTIARKQGFHFMPPGTCREIKSESVMDRKIKAQKRGKLVRKYKIDGKLVTVSDIAKLAGIGRGKTNQLLLHMTPEEVIKNGREWKVNRNTKKIYRA